MEFDIPLPYRNYFKVKLNNPLMGTETLNYKQLHQIQIVYHVKLNNPLMGTETSKLNEFCINLLGPLKLN